MRPFNIISEVIPGADGVRIVNADGTPEPEHMNVRKYAKITPDDFAYLISRAESVAWDYKKAAYEDRKRLVKTLDFLRDLAGTGQIDPRIVLLVQAYAEGQDLFEAECSNCGCVTKAWTTHSFYEAGVVVNQAAVCYSCENAW